MNIAHRLFQKHGQTHFNVWLDMGETTCAAFQEGDFITVGLLPIELWEEVQWNPKRGDILKQQIRFMRVYDVRIVKSGWFASAIVDFIGSWDNVLRGKTDKAFAEFLASAVPLINQDGRMRF